MPTTGSLTMITDAHGYYDPPFPATREEGHDGKTQTDSLATNATVLTHAAKMGFSNGSLAHGAAQASMGVLKAQADASFPAQYGQGYVTGSGFARFIDYIPLGDKGTVTTYTFRFDVHGTHTVPGFEIGGTLLANALAKVSVSDDQGLVLNWQPATWTSTDTDFDHLFEQTFTLTSPRDGAYLVVSAELSVMAYVSGSSQYRFADVNYYNTAVFDMDVSPGGHTVGASGHDYLRQDGGGVVPIPEPATAALLAAAMLGLVARRPGQARKRVTQRA